MPKPRLNLMSIRPSHIHGDGLFAALPIAEGTLLGCYEGPVVEDDGPHVLWVWNDADQQIGIDGQNDLRFVNHSLRPNVEFMGAELVALRDIEPGEELYHHYGDDWVAEA